MNSPYFPKYQANHSSLSTLESDKVQWTDSDIDHYFYADSLKKSSSGNHKIVVPVRNLYQHNSNNLPNSPNYNDGKILPSETLSNMNDINYRNNGSRHSKNNKKTKQGGNLQSYSNSNLSNTTLVNKNGSGSKKGGYPLSKKNYDKELPIPKELKKNKRQNRSRSRSRSHTHTHTHSHSRSHSRKNTNGYYTPISTPTNTTSNTPTLTNNNNLSMNDISQSKRFDDIYYSSYHSSNKSHSRHPSLNYDEEIIFVNDSMDNNLYRKNLSQSSLNPLLPKKVSLKDNHES